MGKNMRSWIWVVAGALCLCGSAVWAQGPKAGKQQRRGDGPAQRPGPQQEREGQEPPFDEVVVKQLSLHLDLREDQQKKIKALLDKARPEAMKLEAEMKVLHERMKKTMFRVKESVREVLDIEQKEKFDEGAGRFLMMRAGPPMSCPQPRGGRDMGQPAGGRMGPPMGPPEMMGQPPRDGPGGPMSPEGDGPGRMDGPPPSDPQGN